MTIQDVTISHYFIAAVTEKARQQGHDINKLLSRAGIPPKFINQSKARVPAEKFAKLQMLTMRDLEDEMLGYCDTPSPPGSWEAMCHWLISCKNLHHALKRIERFQRFFHCGFNVWPEVTRNALLIHVAPWNNKQTIEPYGYELYMFSLHRQLCWLVNTNLAIREAHLPYPSPAHLEEYRAMFPKALLRFSANRGTLVLARNSRELVCGQSLESLKAFLKRPLYNIIVNDYSHQNWTDKTGSALRQHLPRRPTLVQIAAELGIPSKKLMRQLEREGTQYSVLKAQVRRDLAIRLLTRQEDSIERISEQLGFAESSTFVRAFKEWTGITPLKYRKLF